MPQIAGLLIMLMGFLCSAMAAQSPDTVMGPPLEQPVPGSSMVFPVYFHNPLDRPAAITLPATLTCRLESPEETVTVEAQRTDPADAAIVQVGAKGYIKSLYELVLPISLTSGPVRLTAPGLDGTSLLIPIQTAAPTFMVESEGDLAQAQQERPDMSVFINAYQPYAKNISFYQPMYFLVGTDPEDSTFQISFKYRFFSPEKPLAQEHPWVQNFHFGYTQTSFWDLSSASKPFEDTSYKPELFYLSQNIDSGIAWLKGFFVQTGVEHESNGGGPDRSRSTNYAYIEPSFIFLNEKELTGLRIAPRFWLYIENEESNDDLKDYRGYFDLRLTFGKGNSLIVDSHFRAAQKGTSIQVDLTYPLHRLFRNNLDFYLQMQYANVLAESLLNYTERTEAVRIGLAIVR